jgi:hypothetical protein
LFGKIRHWEAKRKIQNCNAAIDQEGFEGGVGDHGASLGQFYKSNASISVTIFLGASCGA